MNYNMNIELKRQSDYSIMIALSDLGFKPESDSFHSFQQKYMNEIVMVKSTIKNNLFNTSFIDKDGVVYRSNGRGHWMLCIGDYILHKRKGVVDNKELLIEIGKN